MVTNIVRKMDKDNDTYFQWLKQHIGRLKSENV